MTATRDSGRRQFLRDVSLTALGSLLGSAGTFASWRRPSSAPNTRAETVTPTAATRDQGEDVWKSVSLTVSLTALQREAKQSVQARAPMSDAVSRLGGMTGVLGWMKEGDDVWLLGARDASHPPIGLDELVVALRSAFQVSQVYQDAPGCSIDPRRGAADPWSLQEVRVLGMPVDCPMGARFVAVDYELKKAAAGLVSLGKDIPSVSDLARRDVDLCGLSGPPEAQEAQEVSHRLWFCANYPPAQRFLREETCVFIVRPVGVQVLTEQEFFDAMARRIGKGPPAPAVRQFTTAVSGLLASASRPAYASLQRDFRVIESAKLLRVLDDSVQRLEYLLSQHQLATAPVPRFVTGIRRVEQIDVDCEGELTESEEGGRRIVQSRRATRRHRYQFEGGVTCAVDLPSALPAAPVSAATANLRRRIVAARPSEHTVAWQV